MPSPNRGSQENNPEAKVAHSERIKRLTPLRQALATILEAEIDAEFSSSDDRHRMLNTGPGRVLSYPFVFGSMIALPGDDSYEVRVHLPEAYPEPDVTVPLHRASPGGRSGVTVYHYRPERLTHLVEVMEILRVACRESQAAST